MRGFVLFAVVAGLIGAARVADAEVLNFGTVPTTGEVRYLGATAASFGGSPFLVDGTITSDPDHWFSFATPPCDFSATCAFSPNLALSDVVTPIAFRCAPPADAVGTRVAVVSFTGSQQVANLVCTAGGAVFQLTPPGHVLDFGAVDLRRAPAVPAKSVIKVKNIGTAPETIGPGAVSGAQFTAAAFSSQTLQPGAEVSITISYSPATERTSANPDLGTYEISRLVNGNPSVLAFTLQGHGVDRHALVAAVGTVPETFVKPGGAAPTIDVTVANTGGAVLGLSGATVVGDSWSLANPDAVDMPGNSPFAFHLRFAPTVAGAAAPATFTVTTSDPDAPTLTATLSGTGKARVVTMGPATVDLQYVAVGTTAKISDGTRGELLQIANRDPANAFAIRSLVILGGEQAFAIPDAVGTTLPPNTTLSFDVSFSPLHLGTYDAIAVLRLDADPDPAATVALHGESVFVNAVGGGGCSVGGSSGLALVIVVLLFALRRHRLAVAGALAIAATTSAETRNLDLAIFDPTPSTTASWFQLQSAEVGNEGDWAASALVSYANDPLTLRTPPNDNVAIADRMMFQLGGAFAFGDRFEAGLKFPLYLQSGENLNSATMFGEPTASGTAAGDLAVHAKARLFDHHGPVGGLAVGVTTALALPTATGNQFAGSSKPQLDALALISFVPARLRQNLSLTAQAGAVLRATAVFHGVDQGNGILWGLGASYRVLPAVALEAELFGQLIPRGLHDAPTGGAATGPAHALDAIEGLLGLHYQLERRVNIGLAFGRGITSAPGTPNWRGVLAVTFAPTAVRSVGARRIAGDSDHDGIPNDVDKCPDEAEDKDGFEDEDGCPDWDNDGDGIADSKDKCPNVPEDRDGFEDDDGCPEIDNDKDGILDRFDHCPNEPETINGIDDEDGCPDKGDGLVTIDKAVVNVAEEIQFTASGKIAPASFNGLGQLGATLRAHSDLITILVTAHAKRHAQTVIDWLVQYGIAAERLEAATAEPDSARIEITIVDRY
ncbi:hypothetical protein BH11MYX1_BH11MYX1_17260 [soil metagenome]